MVEGEAGSLGSNAAADQSGDSGRLTASADVSEIPMDAAGGAEATNAPRSRGDAEPFEKLGVGDEDALSFSYDGEEMEELEEEEVLQEPGGSAPEGEEPRSQAGKGPPVAVVPQQGPTTRLAMQRAGFPSGVMEQHQHARHMRPEGQGHERYDSRDGRSGGRGMGPVSSGQGIGMGPGPAMGPFPQMMPGMMGGTPMMHGRPMTRKEFQHLQAMGGMGGGMGGMGAGMLHMFGGDPSTLAHMLASQGMRMPYDPLGGMSAASGSGVGHGHLSQADLPPHMRGNQTRPAQENGGSNHGISNGNGSQPGSRMPIPLPHRPPPPRGPPPPPAPRPGSAPSSGAYQYSTVVGSAPEMAAGNRHAVHVWERDAHVGGLLPPAGYSPATVPTQLPRPRPEERAKLAADLEFKRLSLRVAQLARENARQAAVLSKQEAKARQDRAIEAKKASLAAEMAEIRRQIAVQELRQAGKEVPPELLVPVEQPPARATPLGASSAPVPSRDAAARRAAALGREPSLLPPAAKHPQAGGELPAAVDVVEPLRSVPVAPSPSPSAAAVPLAAPPLSSDAAELAGAAQLSAEWDDGGWPEPQDEDWATAADLEGSGTKRRRESSTVEAGDSRPGQRSRSHCDASGGHAHPEEGSAGVEGAEATRPRSARDVHSRKESKSHRSEKGERKHRSRHRSHREHGAEGELHSSDQRRTARRDAQREVTPEVLDSEPRSQAAPARGGSDRPGHVDTSDDLRQQLEARRAARLARD